MAHPASFSHGRAIRTAQLTTDPGLCFTRNAEQPLVAIGQMLASVCLEMLAPGDAWLAETLRLPEMELSVRPGTRTPSTLATGRFVGEKLLRSARLRLRRADRPAAWFLALRRNTPQSYVSIRTVYG